MGVLRRIDVDRPIVIGERAIPVCAHTGCCGVTKGLRRTNAIAGVKKLDANIREVGVSHHLRPLAVADRMPGVETGYPSLATGVGMDGAHAFGPVGDRQFARAGNPGFVGDPFAGCTLIEAAIVAAIAVDQPNAVGKGAGIEEQIVVIGTELHVGHRVTAQDDLACPPLCIDNRQTSICAGIELYGPVTIIVAERGGTHRRGDHPLFAHGNRPLGCGQLGKIDQLLFGQRFQIDPPAAAARGKINIAPIARRVDRPIG